MTSINSILASEHVAGLHRTAEAHRLAKSSSVAERASRNETIALRLAQPDEGAIVTRLAALDDQPVLAGRVVLAVADGEPIAALSLTDGRVVANPFVRTTDAVELLRLREQHLRGVETRRGWRAVLHLRLALR
jgi:hypothetical protein